MDVSKPQDLKGGSENKSELLEEVASLTGLPQEWVQSELTKIVTNSGHKPAELTLDELRTSMLAYLEEMQKELEAQEQADLEILHKISGIPQA